MKVKDIMSTSICGIRENSTVKEAAMQMKRTNVGSLPVCTDKGQILGIVTDRDIAIRFVASEGMHDSISTIMSTNIVTVTPDTDIHEAALLLAKHKIRRLPVTAGDKLVGFLSLGDIASKKLLIDEAGDVLSSISKSNRVTLN